MKRLSGIFPIILFSILSFVIVFPLLPPGYILTMDAIFTPKMPWPSLFSSSFLYESLLASLSLLISSFWLEKIIMFLIFFLSALGMSRLVSADNLLARTYSGILYAVNPLVYERLVSGQLGFLLGYSLFPFVVKATFDFYSGMNNIKALKLAILVTLMVTTAIHFVLIFSVFFLIYSIFFFSFNTKFPISFNKLLIFLGFIFIFNSNWIIPSVFGFSDVSQAINGFNRNDLVAFQSVSDKNFGLIFNLLAGYGFWREPSKQFVSPKDVIFFWPLLALIIIGVSFLGLYKMFQDKDKLLFPPILTFLVMFILSLDLAGGIALKPFANTAYFLYDKFPPLRGLREPQKLVGIIILCYAFFGGIGLGKIIRVVKTRASKIALFIIFLMLPLIYTPVIFGGFWGQLKPVFYPQSWFIVNNIIKSDTDNFLVLFFPWHQYMRFNFNNNLVIANPAPNFFEKSVLSSRNYETVPLYGHDQRPEALHVEGLLSIHKNRKNLLGQEVNYQVDWGADLSPIGVKYIILAKESDWKSYSFLDRSDRINKIYEDEQIILYKNLEFSQVVIPGSFGQSLDQPLDESLEVATPSGEIIQSDLLE